MSSRRIDTSTVDAAIQDKFQSVTRYRQERINAGNESLQQVLETEEVPDTFMTEVPQDGDNELVRQAEQLRSSSRGQSPLAALQAERAATQLMLRALESPDEAIRQTSSFYNPITQQRESLTEDSPEDFFQGSLSDMEKQLQQRIRGQLENQMQPFMSQFEQERQQLREQLASSNNPQVFQQQLDAIDNQQRQVMGEVINETFGVELDLTNLQGRDLNTFQRVTGSSVDDYLARTQEELIEIYGEEGAATEQTRRQLLSERFDANRSMALDRNKAVDELNDSISSQNQENLQAATDIRRQAKEKEGEFRRLRRSAGLDFGSGLSLNFGDRPQ